MKSLFPLILLGIGVILLLVNFGVISLEIKEIFVVILPFLIFLVGIKWLFKGMMRPSLSLVILGGFLTIFSSLLIADQFGYYEFSFSDGWKLWPLVFILIGVWMLAGMLRRKPKYPKKKIIVRTGDDHEYSDIESIMESVDKQIKNANKQVGEGLKNIGKNIKIDISKSSDHPGKKVEVRIDGDKIESLKTKKSNNFGVTSMSLKEPNWELTPLQLSSTVGDYYFDFSKAYIPDEEIAIVIKCWVSDIKMIVPEDIPIKVNTKINIGDVKVMGNYWGGNCAYTSTGYDEATRKLNIYIKSWVGDVRIEKV